jgi:hypothetical protein
MISIDSCIGSVLVLWFVVDFRSVVDVGIGGALIGDC